MPPRHSLDQGLKKYPDGTWGVRCYVGKRTIIEKVGTKQEARKRRDELKLRAYEAPEEPIRPQARKTIAEWCLEFAAIAPRRSGDSARAWAERLKGAYPEEVTVGHVNAWARTYQAEGYSAASVHRELCGLRGAYKIARHSGEVDPKHSPFRNPGELELPRINNLVERYLEFDEEELLAAQLGEWWPHAEFAYLTGLRWSNQMEMEQTWVNVAQALVVVPLTKNGDRHVCHLSSRALELVKAQLAKWPKNKLVWPHPSTGGLVDAGNFRKRVWLPAVERAGIPPISWHCLRHTTASRMIQATGDSYSASLALGHRDQRMIRRYAHLGDTRMKAQMEALAGYKTHDRP